jgi:tetratricopeptide (TPR) repeat protein
LDFSKHIQKAEDATRRRNYDFAVEVYQQLLDIDPDQGQARAGLRQVLKKRQEAKKGGKFLRALVGAGPLATAKALSKAGRHGAAVKSFESYLATNPLDVPANLALGEALEAAGHFQSACAVYEFVAEIDPRNAAGLKRAGAMLHRTGDPARALEFYERALEADPRDQEAIKARKDLAAEAALSKGRYGEVKHSREQIKDKDQAEDLERSVRRHRSEEELKADLARLEDRYAEEPSDVDLMLCIADVHERLHDPEAALDLVERAAQYRKDSVDLHQRRGALKEKVLKKQISRADKDGRTDEASRLEGTLRVFQAGTARAMVALRPHDAALRLALARILVRDAEYDEAIGELQKAVDDPRVRREVLFCLGRCFQEKGYMELARKEYEQALEAGQTLQGRGLDERSKEILYNLGAIAEREGQGNEARSFYSRIFEADIAYRDVATKMEQFK